MTTITIEALKTSYKSLGSKSDSIDTFSQGFKENPQAGLLDIYEGGTPSSPQAVALWGGYISARLSMETKDVAKHSTVLSQKWKEVHNHIMTEGVDTVITRINELQKEIDNTPPDYAKIRKGAIDGLEKNAKALRDVGITSNTEEGKVKDLINTLLRELNLPSLNEMLEERTLENA
jgi:hypothetical protein